MWDVVEEELILALPPFSYHPVSECQQIEVGLPPASTDDGGEGRSNPFDVLAQLKPGNEK